jgi:ubiquinone/menaquinone biosynthesis C-methylase UbiE
MRHGTVYPERIIPDEEPPGIVALHLKRYDFARAWCRDNRILDVACGTGYGAYHLAEVAGYVIGVDVAPQAIAYAVQRYQAPNLVFQVMDAGNLAFEDDTFDAVCSFEAIEHLLHVHDHLCEVVRVLCPAGVYLVSTPNVRKSNPHPDNPFHQQEWCPRDFEALLRDYFDEVELFGQRRRQTWLHALVQRADFLELRARLAPEWLARTGARATGTRAMGELRLDDVLITKNHLQKAAEIVAVCHEPLKCT